MPYVVTVETVLPVLTVRMPLAATAQPATALNGYAPTAGTSVLALVLDGGATYVLGAA